jgi:hypothetical protein
MFEPKSYAVQLALMITSMCCWGSWVNSLKLTPGWCFQSFYWAYVVGLFLTLLGGGTEFFHGLTTASLTAIGYALLTGIIFNAANQLDLPFYKKFPIVENQDLEFRAEFFNILNHSQFSTPDVGLGDLSFGAITATVHENRQIQFALKYRF